MRVMGVDDEEDCDTGLGLGMSIVAGEYHHSPPLQLDLLPFAPVPRDSASSQMFPPPKTLSDHGSAKNVVDVNKLPSGTHNGNMAASPTYSNVSSFHVDSNFIHQEAIASYGISRKRGRDHGVKEDFEMEKGCSKMSDEEEEGGGGTRKKLRLSKDQSALLEESFKENSTLNTKQKQVLAKQLNLRPRQVEVWFQNRRARTKLKQTEVDCEFLKGCYESLTDENRRLQREIAELRAVKMATAASPMYMQLPRATLTMCPSCERVITSENSTGPLTSLQKPYVYPSYTHSSVAC